MRTLLTACLLLSLDFIAPTHTSFLDPLQDLEGSGDDLGNSDYGSGDWSKESTEVASIGKVLAPLSEADGGTESSFDDFDHQTPLRPAGDSRTSPTLGTQRFYKNKELVAAVIAGGVTGVSLAAVLGAILLYRRERKEALGYSAAQQEAKDAPAHICKNEQVVLV